MSSATSASKPDASGTAPKQLEHIPHLKLSDGNEIPMIGYGLGTANFKRGNKEGLDEKIINDTVTAIKNGYYHLDCAEAYGNEAEVGVAIARAGVPRDKLFITTKTSCNPGDTIEAALSRSLAKLGLDYVDLYLIHSPYWASSPAELQRRWAEMEVQRDAGRARSIGVSNYLREHLEAVLAAAPRHPPVVNQIEYHPYLQHDPDGAGGLLAYLRGRGSRAAPGPVDPVYDRLAKKYGVTAGEVALRWCLDQGIVAVTTSSSEERLRQWMTRLPTFKLTPEEVEEIAEKGREKHYRGFWTNKFAEDDRR
ncbi:51c300ca-3542-45ca-9a51-08ec0f3087a8 [Thermothielavioides terrestris]|uniref:51c300ca-3542-45ca-9a51-08ec0f3087a8 n=1 Tax=Thermothielavioides terrestris TaxID=2587410 RepID=A0A3S4BRV2_9PEZI|nr:51c300ca-3542-45ca-9a51-08ec0f3087a8 [Thermothielavioides terrestris]